MKHKILQFLLHTVPWNAAWFNKPKFHILVHLPNHIRRFGPAILFATEAFESFNAVIREKSIHSNRSAPSLDIARAFAQCDRLRHIASGGFFPKITPECVVDEPGKSVTLRRPRFTADPEQWVTWGALAKGIIGDDTVVARYLGVSIRDTERKHTTPVVNSDWLKNHHRNVQVRYGGWSASLRRHGCKQA